MASKGRPKVIASAHSVDRYIQRIDGTASPSVARAIILAAIETASRLREKSFKGDTMFVSANGSMRLVVAEERGFREILTVLGPNPVDSCDTDELPELAREVYEAELSSRLRQLNSPTGNTLEAEMARLLFKVQSQGVKLNKANTAIQELKNDLQKAQDEISALKSRLTARTINVS